MDWLPHESTRVNPDCCDKHVAAEMQRDMGTYSLVGRGGGITLQRKSAVQGTNKETGAKEKS